MIEEFKILPKFPRYRIYNDGRVYTLIYNKFLRPFKNRDGYCCYTLFGVDGVPRGIKAHRLVAMAFVPNPNKLPEVNHKDGNKGNNYYANLEWCTHSQNIKHAWDNSLIKNTPERVQKIKDANLNREGEMNPTSKPVILLNSGEIFESMRLAGKHIGRDSSGISGCCHGKRSYCGVDKDGEPLRWAFYFGRSKHE